MANESSRSMRRRRNNHLVCRPGQLCVKCSLVSVVSHRFDVFRAAFGREPGLDEELFFDETKPQPVRARRTDIRRQIIAAARVRKLNALPLLNYLGFSASAAGLSR
jgi:hypothetical protein